MTATSSALSATSSTRRSPSRSCVTRRWHWPPPVCLKGRRTAAYPALEPDVTAAGATYVDSDAVVDGEMVSARAWPDHPSWMREFIRLLQKKAPVTSKETAGVR